MMFGIDFSFDLYNLIEPIFLAVNRCCMHKTKLELIY